MTEIPSVVARFWEERGHPIILSQLGASLSPESLAELRVAKGTLKGYISLHLSDKVRLVHLGGNTDAAAPWVQTTGMTDEQIAKKATLARERKVKINYPAFKKDVWAAFSQPIKDRIRYLEIQDGGEPVFHERETEIERSGYYRISADDLPEFDPGTGRATPFSIAQAIRLWAGKVGVSLDRLYSDVVEPASGAQATSPLNALANALGMLEPHEAARISIPGDVLLSVIKRSR
ncbi:MAG TPA: hypothetical protein VD906_00765 [Caulobacteraceae bacterium]|nr:hypothetical protein [Caulobacteraceae bacterium]